MSALKLWIENFVFASSICKPTLFSSLVGARFHQFKPVQKIASEPPCANLSRYAILKFQVPTRLATGIANMESPARLFFQNCCFVARNPNYLHFPFGHRLFECRLGWSVRSECSVQVLERKFCVAERVALKSKSVCPEQFARQEAPPPSTVAAWFYRAVSEI